MLCWLYANLFAGEQLGEVDVFCDVDVTFAYRSAVEFAFRC